MNLTKVTVFALIITSTIVQAAVRRGNGGMAVICYDDIYARDRKIVSMKLLDFFEAELNFGYTIDLGPKEIDIDKRLEIAFSRLDRLDPVRSEGYRERYTALKDNHTFSTKHHAIDNPRDSGEVYNLGENCHLRIAAFRLAEVSSVEKQYQIDPSIYGQFDSDDHRAGLLLHEVVYGVAFDDGHTDSAAARKLVALMASPAIEQLDQAEYDQLIDTWELSTKKQLFDAGPFGAFEDLSYMPNQAPMNLQQASDYCETKGRTLAQLGTEIWRNTSYEFLAKRLARSGFFQDGIGAHISRADKAGQSYWLGLPHWLAERPHLRNKGLVLVMSPQGDQAFHIRIAAPDEEHRVICNSAVVEN